MNIENNNKDKEVGVGMDVVVKEVDDNKKKKRSWLQKNRMVLIIGGIVVGLVLSGIVVYLVMFKKNGNADSKSESQTGDNTPLFRENVTVADNNINDRYVLDNNNINVPNDVNDSTSEFSFLRLPNGDDGTSSTLSNQVPENISGKASTLDNNSNFGIPSVSGSVIDGINDLDINLD